MTVVAFEQCFSEATKANFFKFFILEGYEKGYETEEMKTGLRTSCLKVKRSLFFKILKEQCLDVFSHFSGYFQIEGNLNTIVF